MEAAENKTECRTKRKIFFRRKKELTELERAQREKRADRRWFYLILFLLPAAVLELVYITFKVFPFGDDSLLVLDLNAQYIYYYEAFRDAILGDGSLLYSWSRSLGGEFLGILAYYTASPFMVVYLIFPKGYITEALLTTALLKTSFASLSFGHFLNVTRGGQKIKILIFCLMYSLMSYFVIQQMDPMWLDEMIALPMIMLGLNRMVKERKFILYTVSLTYAFLSNFYIGYMVAIFTFLYFFYAFFTCEETKEQRLKKLLARGLEFGAFSILAALMSCIILIPTYFSLTLGKFEFQNPSYELKEKFQLIELLPKLLFGAYDTCRPEGLPTLFCGTLTLLTLPLFYVNKKIPVWKKIMSTIICAILLLSMNMSTVDMFWHGMQNPNWINYRYSFLLCTFMLLMGYEAFSNVEDGYSPGDVGLAMLACMALIFFVDAQDLEWLEKRITIWGSIGLVVIYFSALSYDAAKKGRNNVVCMGIMLAFVCIELYLNAFTNICMVDSDVVYSSRVSYRDFVDPYYEAAEWIRDNDTGFYRTEKTKTRCVNDAMALGTYGISHSSSTLNTDAINYLKDLGYSTGSHWTKYISPILGTDSIIGIKYVIQEKETNYGLEEIGQVGDLYIYRNNHAMPVCFPVSEGYAVYDTEQASENPFELQNRMLSAMVGSDEVIPFYTEISADRITVEYENVETKLYGEGYTKYYIDVTGLNSHIEFKIQGQENMTLYAAFPSNYPRKVNIWINKEWYNTYLSSSTDDGIIPLGKYGADEEVSLIMTILPKDDSDGTGEVFLGKKLFYAFDEALFESYFGAVRDQVISLEKESDTKLVLTVNALENQELYCSIPYERGWNATVDGVEAETYRTENGLLGLKLPEGTHTVVLRFLPDYFVFACIISGAALLLFVLIIVLSKVFSGRNALKKLLAADAEEEPESEEDVLPPREDGSGNSLYLVNEIMKADGNREQLTQTLDGIFGLSNTEKPAEPETPTQEEASPAEPETPAQEEAFPAEPETPAQEEAFPAEPETPAQEEAFPAEPETPAPADGGSAGD